MSGRGSIQFVLLMSSPLQVLELFSHTIQDDSSCRIRAFLRLPLSEARNLGVRPSAYPHHRSSAMFQLHRPQHQR
jgi:hypothetical protein